MTFVLGRAPIPLTDPVARPKRRDQFSEKQKDPLEGTMSDAWADYFSRLVSTVAASATRISSAAKVAQSASIAATDISGGTLKAGVYRVSYYTRITQAAGTSSSLTVTLSWTDGGVAQSQAFAAIVGNTTTSLQTEAMLIRIDSGSPVRYATAYVSVGAPAMEYSLDVILEVMDA